MVRRGLGYIAARLGLGLLTGGLRWMTDAERAEAAASVRTVLNEIAPQHAEAFAAELRKQYAPPTLTAGRCGACGKRTAAEPLSRVCLACVGPVDMRDTFEVNGLMHGADPEVLARSAQYATPAPVRSEGRH